MSNKTYIADFLNHITSYTYRLKNNGKPPKLFCTVTSLLCGLKPALNCRSLLLVYAPNHARHRHTPVWLGPKEDTYYEQ